MTLNPLLSFVSQVDQRSLQSVREVGYLAALLVEAFYWLLFGHWRRQPVRLGVVFKEAVGVGVNAIPIVALASFATGMMLAIQGIYTLRTFGAEEQVVLGIALSVTREFAPLITGIFVAGRSGSAIAARIGTMQISQEIDAFRRPSAHGKSRELENHGVARMIRKMLILISVLMAGVAFAAPPALAEAPVEIISAEFGLFDVSNPAEMVFEPGDVVPHRVGQRYGWIIEVKTTRRTLSVREEYLLPGPPRAGNAPDPLSESLNIPIERRNQVSQRQLVPVEGKIYGEWAVGHNEPAGHRRLQVVIEGQVAASFEYDVK